MSGMPPVPNFDVIPPAVGNPNQQNPNIVFGSFGTPTEVERPQHQQPPVVVATPQQPPVVVATAPTPPVVGSHAERPEKFSGSNFKRWQQKMLFYLTTLNLARFLSETEPQPQVDEGVTNVQAVSAVQAWKHSDFLCRNYVLNGLSDALYNVYCKAKTAKELWDTLDKKYKTEDAGTKKYAVARFLDFKMVDSKSVMSQVQELQIIVSDIHAEKMTICETFQVGSMIEKLPPSWVEFKNYLKHKRKEMTVEDLIVRLRIEEDNKNALKATYAPAAAKANMVEHGQSSKARKGKGKPMEKKGKAKVANLAPKPAKMKTTFQGTCFNCEQTGHQAVNCKLPKRDRPR